MPAHKLVLKVGSQVMCMRNLYEKKQIVNGTRLLVLNCYKRCIKVKIISEGNFGYEQIIPRIKLVSVDSDGFPFIFSRKQLPIGFC